MILTEPAQHAQQADPIVTALLILAALTIWALSLLARPIGTCRTCRGARVLRTPRRVRTCRACQGTGYRRRIGATTIHRLYWTLRTERDRQQRHDPHTDQHANHTGRP